MINSKEIVIDDPSTITIQTIARFRVMKRVSWSDSSGQKVMGGMTFVKRWLGCKPAGYLELQVASWELRRRLQEERDRRRDAAKCDGRFLEHKALFHWRI